MGVDGAALELAATRRWHGFRGRLDELPLGQVASAAFAELRDAEGDRRRVLAEELPDYLAARREPFNKADLDEALAASDADGLGAAITDRDSIAREHAALIGAIDLATDHIASDRIAAENEGALAIQVRLVQLHH